MGRYSAEIFRACRLVVDTGLHYYNWTRERAINYMLNYTAYGLSDITTEINRYITWPGQACAYKIGELKIRELREKAEQILGKKFDIKNFHFVILQNGAMPLTTLESVVDSWISERDSSSSEEEDTPADDLAELQNSFSEWILYENPEFATMINDRRYDDRLDDFSIEAFDRWKDQVDNYLDELYNIPQESLSPKLQIDYDVFEDFLLTYRDGWEWRMFNALNPINFLEGPQADPETIVKTMPKYTKGNFENFLVRIKQYPKQIQNMKERFQKAIETNHTYHMVSIESVAKRIKAMVKKKPEDFVFYKPFKTDLDKLTSIDKAEKEEMRTRAKAAISKLMTSLDDISTFIEESYQPHVRTGYGVSSWSSGSEFYKACLEWHISLTLTPEQVHQIGLQEVKRISTQMKKIFEKLGITGTIKECFDKLKKDKKYFYKHGKDIVNHFNEVIHGQIEPKLKLLFKDLPNLPVVVEPMPYNGPTGIYLTGSPDGTKPGTFQVNVRHPDELPTFTFMSLALHEAIPGHHTQISVQLLADIPGYRRNGVDSKYFQPPTLFPYYTAFVEGWALYAEFLGEEMGMYKTDEEMLGRYNDEIFRAGRLVVDTGLHYFGWSRDRAIEYMSNFSAAGENELETEIDRYITWPGQACAYKIGELKIKELRNKASNELGEDFDIRDFHSVVLNNGPMPLKLLEKVVYHWIKDVKKEKEGERERQKAVVVVTKPETSGSWVIHRAVPAVLISSALLLAFYLRQR